MAQASKKRRVTRACDHCRLKRAKCDGATPACSFCVTTNATCTYTQAAKKRGLPTGYIHDLEKKVVMFQAILTLLASMKTMDGTQIEHYVLDLLQSQSSTQLLAQMESIQQNWDSSSMSVAMAKYINDNHEEVRKAKNVATLSLELLRPGLDMAPSVSISTIRTHSPQTSGLNPTVDPVTGLHSSQTGQILPKNEPVDITPFILETDQIHDRFSPSSLEEFTMVQVNEQPSFLRDEIFQFIADELDPDAVRDQLVALKYHGLPQQISGFSGSTITKYNAHHYGRRNPFRVGTIFDVSSSVMAANANRDQRKLPLDIFRFPANLRKLIDNYFQIYHLWLPMLDRILIIRQVFRLQQNPGKTPDIHDCNVLALLWAILALESSNVTGTEVTRYVRNCILALENAPATTIETIQAMILLGLHFYQSGNWDNSWVLVLSATRMAIDVRLMRPAVIDEELRKDDDNSKHPAWASLNNINRERTWASVFAVNTLLGARMGRSPLVRESDWGAPIISEDGWEEWEAWKSYHQPETFLLDSGRCLLTFNQLLKVVSILNSVVTSTISFTGGSAASAGDSPQNLLIYDLQIRLDDWLEQLPHHCQLGGDHQSPMVMFLHLCHCLTWLVICVKLLAVKGNMDPEREKVVSLRNQLYTKACLQLSSILSNEGSMVLLHYPFMDYLVLMALNFPNMISLDSAGASAHSYRLIEILENGARTSVPCQITWDMYRLQNGVQLEPQASKGPGVMFQTPQIQSGYQDKQSALYSNKQLLDTLVFQEENAHKIKEEDKQDSILQFFSGNHTKFPALPNFDYTNRPRYASYNQHAPKEELDLFMLDTDFAKNDSRLDKFMRNLGYVSSGAKGDFLSHSLSATHLAGLKSDLSTPLLPSETPDMDAATLSDLLHKDKGNDT